MKSEIGNKAENAVSRTSSSNMEVSCHECE